MKQIVKNILCRAMAFSMILMLAACGKLNIGTADKDPDTEQTADSSKDAGGVKTPSGSSGLTQNAEGYYEIASAEDFMAFSELLRNYISENPSSYDPLPQNAVLTADIDLSAYCGEGNSLYPLGAFIVEEGDTSRISYARYAGIFNGNGHTISGIYMNAQELEGNAVGLFGHFGSYSGFWEEENARVCDLTIADSTFKGAYYAGAIVGESRNGTIEHCVIAETVSVSSEKGQAGGIVGYNEGDIGALILRCENYGYIEGNSVGGILGEGDGKAYVVQCDNYGTVTGMLAGGIAGTHRGSNFYEGLILA